MDYFVTGATGFIGSRLVKRLLANGSRVRILARQPRQAERLFGNQVEIVKGSVSDCAALRNGMAGCDGLFHLANLYSMWEKEPSRFWQVNVEGTRTVLEAALESGIKRVVYVSTVAVYGKPAEQPFNEADQPGPQLFSEYARTKAAADRTAWDLHDRRGLPLVVLYPGIVLGAGDPKASGHYIQDLIHGRAPSTIFHNSAATYVYVGDVVDALVQAMVVPGAAGQKYLVGEHTLDGRAYADLIREVSGRPLPLLRLPDWVVLAAAYLLTAAAGITGRAPAWGLSVDAAWTLKKGFWMDGSKARRELGITYTPIRTALAEEVVDEKAAQSFKG